MQEENKQLITFGTPNRLQIYLNAHKQCVMTSFTVKHEGLHIAYAFFTKFYERYPR